MGPIRISPLTNDDNVRVPAASVAHALPHPANGHDTPRLSPRKAIERTRRPMDNMASAHNTIVFGAFRSGECAGHAINKLIAARLVNAEVSLLMARQMRPGLQVDAVLSLSGVESFVGAGPVMVALARLTVQRANDVVQTALTGVGFPYADARRFEGHLRDGSVLVGVHCDALDEIARAQHILRISGANDISSAGLGIVRPRPIPRRCDF